MIDIIMVLVQDNEVLSLSARKSERAKEFPLENSSHEEPGFQKLKLIGGKDTQNMEVLKTRKLLEDWIKEKLLHLCDLSKAQL